MNTFEPSLRIVMFLLLFVSAAAQQEPTFSAESNVVLVPTLVTDAKDNAVYGLQAKDFIIDDDGVEQVSHLDEAAEAQPVSLIVAIQCGRRAAREFARMRGLASMLQPVLSAPNTETALLFFDSTLRLAHNFTNDFDVIEKSLKG